MTARREVMFEPSPVDGGVADISLKPSELKTPPSITQTKAAKHTKSATGWHFKAGLGPWKP